MAGAGLVILFVVSLAGWSIWTAIYVLFAGHYFLTVVTDSSAGADEVQFPSEGVLDWWWKPLFCLWILSTWIIPTAILSGPLLVVSPIAFGIGFALLLLLVYPMSLVSALYSGNWFFLMHPQVVWRLVKHFRAFVYVHAITLVLLSTAALLIAAAFGRSLLWALPAALAIPTTLLLYARHWGRFAWLALNFEANPQRKKKRAAEPTPNGQAEAPEMDVQEIDPDADAIAAGLPPLFPTAIQPSELVPAAVEE